MKRLHPPNNAQSHELYGVHRRVRVGIYPGFDAFLAVRSIGSMSLGFAPSWVTIHRGNVDEMRDLAARLGPILDRYASAAGIPVPKPADS